MHREYTNSILSYSLSISGFALSLAVAPGYSGFVSLLPGGFTHVLVLELISTKTQSKYLLQELFPN